MLDVVWVDDNGDPHVNNGRGKKLEIFSLHQMESNLGGRAVACRVVSLGHWASSLLLLQIGHCLRWSDLLLRLCVLAKAPLSVVVNMLNKREESGEDCIWRGEQSGPHVYGRTQASASSKKYFLLMLY